MPVNEKPAVAMVQAMLEPLGPSPMVVWKHLIWAVACMIAVLGIAVIITVAVEATTASSVTTMTAAPAGADETIAPLPSPLTIVTTGAPTKNDQHRHSSPDDDSDNATHQSFNNFTNRTLHCNTTAPSYTLLPEPHGPSKPY